MLSILVLFTYIAIFHELKIGGNPTSNKSIDAILPTAAVNCMSLCHV